LAERHRVEDSSFYSPEPLKSYPSQLYPVKFISVQANTATPPPSYTNPTVLFKVDEGLFQDMSTDELNEMLEGSNQPLSPPIKKKLTTREKFAKLLPAFIRSFVANTIKSRQNERDQKNKEEFRRLFP
jgi:hypothetical protein